VIAPVSIAIGLLIGLVLSRIQPPLPPQSRRKIAVVHLVVGGLAILVGVVVPEWPLVGMGVLLLVLAFFRARRQASD
jgi:hypothetical protein